MNDSKLRASGHPRRSGVVAKCTLQFLLCFWSIAAWSWSDHPLLTYTALHKTPLATVEVEVESLEKFIAATESSLVPFLEEIQKEQQRTVSGWPALPAHLAFRAGLPASEKKVAFFKALRVRSIYPAALYLQPIPGVDYGNVSTTIDVTDIAATKADNVLVPPAPFIALTEGQRVSALQVVTSASDEPDFGMDQKLWEGQSSDGNEYRFGKIPFGRSDLDYSSQAPFHMGFFHEAGILFKLAPNYKVGYGPARVLLYKKLSQLAFAHHHDYWGYRFLGWGLHYIQDATQPYHSSIVPGTPTAVIIAVAALNAAKITKPQLRKNYEVTNLHVAVEDFQFRLISRELANRNANSPFLQALEGDGHEPQVAQIGAGCSPSRFLKEVIATRAYDQGPGLHRGLAGVIPKEMIYSKNAPTPDDDFLKVEEKAPAQSRESFEAVLLSLFGDVGRGTRQFVFDCN